MAKTTSQRLRTYVDTGHKIYATNRHGNVREVEFRPKYPTDRKPWVSKFGEHFDGTECFPLPCDNPECRAQACTETDESRQEH